MIQFKVIMFSRLNLQNAIKTFSIFIITGKITVLLCKCSRVESTTSDFEVCIYDLFVILSSQSSVSTHNSRLFMHIYYIHPFL